MTKGERNQVLGLLAGLYPEALSIREIAVRLGRPAPSIRVIVNRLVHGGLATTISKPGPVKRWAASPEGQASSLAVIPRHLPAALPRHRRHKIRPEGACAYCGDPADTWDHIIPRGRPGWDSPYNLIPACRPCNGSKQQRTPDEWLAWLEAEVARREAIAVAARRRLLAVRRYLTDRVA